MEITVKRCESVLLILVCSLAVCSFCLAVRQMSHSLWGDEVDTANIAREDSLLKVAHRAMLDRPYPPLYFFIAHYSLRLRTDEVGLRLPSAVFGALAVVAVFFLAKTLMNSVVGMIAALVFCLTPGLFRYFVDANPYTLLALISATSTLLLWRALQSGKGSYWLLYTASAVAGLGSHSLFIFQIAAQFAAGLAFRGSADLRVQRRLYQSMSAILLIWIAWSTFFLTHSGQSLPLQFSRLWSVNTLVGLGAMYAGFLTMASPAQFVAWPLLLLTGAWTLYERERRMFVCLLILTAVSLVGTTLFVKATLPYLSYRYGMAVFPLTSVVAACAVQVRAPRAFRAVAIAAVLVYVLAGGLALVSAHKGAFEFQNWRDAAAYLSQHARSRDDVLVYPGWSEGGLVYYYKGSAKRHRVDNEATLAQAIVELCAKSCAEGGRVWVVFSTTENTIPLLERYTGWRGIPLDQAVQTLIQDLDKSGRVSVSHMQSFRRVIVFGVGLP